MNTAGGFPSMLGAYLMNLRISGRYQSLKSSLQRYEAREISASIILQSQSQLKAIYKDNADTIVGNCDTTLFLGGKEKTTLKEISEIFRKRNDRQL